MKVAGVGMLLWTAAVGCTPRSEPMRAKAPVFDAAGGETGFRRFVVGRWSLGYDQLGSDAQKSEVVELMRDTVSQTLTLGADGTARLSTDDGSASGTWKATGTTVVFSFGRWPGLGLGRHGARLRRKVAALDALTPSGDGRRLVSPSTSGPSPDFGLVWERLSE